MLAIVLNLWLIQRMPLPRLPLDAIGWCAAGLLLLGQLAALGPALRAAAVPPVVATRSV